MYGGHLKRQMHAETKSGAEAQLLGCEYECPYGIYKWSKIKMELLNRSEEFLTVLAGFHKFR